MRVVVDTCVLLDGALDPSSNAARLPGLRRAGVSFVVCRWALDEALSVVDREGSGRPRQAQAAALLVEEFAERLAPILMDDGGTYRRRTKDDHAKESISRTGSDYLVTRNLQDFAGYPAIPPIGLLRMHDFAGSSIEAPWPVGRAAGTVALRCRCFPGESFGWLLAGDEGEAVGLDVDGHGRMRALRPRRSRQVNRVPHGSDLTIFARFREGREIQIGYVDHSVDEGSVLIAATYELDRPILFRPFLKYLPGNEWNMECCWMGNIGRWLKDRQLLLVAHHQTCEAVVSGTSVRETLKRLIVLRHEVVADQELLEVALPGSARAKYIRPEWRSS